MVKPPSSEIFPEGPRYDSDRPKPKPEPDAPVKPESSGPQEAQLSPDHRKRLDQKKQSLDVLNSADSPEEIELFQQLNGTKLTPEQIEKLLATPPNSKERGLAMYEILIRMPELNEEDRAQLGKMEGVNEKTFGRNKVLPLRLGGDSFEEITIDANPTRVRIKKGEVEESRGQKIFLRWFKQQFREGTFGEFSEDEMKTIFAQIDEREYIEDWVIGLEDNPVASERARDIFREIEHREEVMGEEVSNTDLIGELVQLEKEHTLVPPAAYMEEKARESTSDYLPLDGDTYGTEEEILGTYGLDDGEVEILGTTASGDVVFSIDNAECAYDPTTSRIDWIKININGTEFLHDPNSLVGQPKTFRREVGLARTKAVLAYHNLPFDGMERDSAIEIMANQTGDVTEFTYDQYSSTLEQKWISFLHALTPAQGATRMAFTRLGMMDQTGQLNRDRYTEVVKEWINNRGGRTPAQFLTMLVKKYGDDAGTERVV